MPADLRPGPDSPPTDELASAEATLGVLQQVLHTIASEDMSRQTPCTQYDVTQLTGHLLGSIISLGGMVGAEFPERKQNDSAERQVIGVARPALDAWHRHGLEANRVVRFKQMKKWFISAAAVVSVAAAAACSFAAGFA